MEKDKTTNECEVISKTQNRIIQRTENKKEE